MAVALSQIDTIMFHQISNINNKTNQINLQQRTWWHENKTLRFCTYILGTSDVVLYFGATTSPMANIPPPLLLSRQCENTFFTFPAAASCESAETFAWPKPIIPSRASSEDALVVPDCLSLHLLAREYSGRCMTEKKKQWWPFSLFL